MTDVPELLRRNTAFAERGFHPELRINPSGNMVIVGCVDPHHTDCGMTDLAAHPDLLAEYFEIPADELDAKAVSDPARSVAVDVAVVTAQLHAPDFFVSGLVYDVATGLIDVVVPPTPLDVA